MLKNILKLDGAQQLSKNEQKEINGGLANMPLCTCGGKKGVLTHCDCYSFCDGSCTQSY